jgi:septal ring-binding cell division protein DamX
MTASFGLGPVSVKEIIAEAPPKKEPVFADRGPADVLAREEVQTPVAPKRRLRRLVMPLSLGIAVVALAVFIVSNARIKGELRAALMGGDSKMSFTPLNYPELSLIKSDLAENTYVADANGIAIIELETGKNLAVKALESEAPAPGPSKTPLQRPRLAKEGYEIVLGCFSVFENANRMASKLAASDVPAYVSGKNHKGMYVVSLGNFPTRELAVEKLAQVKNSYPHAWIKKPE